MARKIDEALERLQKLASVGAPFSARTGAESKYAEAYQEEVRAGRAPQIPAKYRHQSTGKRMPGGHNNSGGSQGKHSPHPAVKGFRVKGYKVESKWNPKEKDSAETKVSD